MLLPLASRLLVNCCQYYWCLVDCCSIVASTIGIANAGIIADSDSSVC